MPRSGPRQIYKYTKEFKLAAVRLSHVPGMQVKAVATALGIHPFMLSKWPALRDRRRTSHHAPRLHPLLQHHARALGARVPVAD